MSLKDFCVLVLVVGVSAYAMIDLVLSRDRTVHVAEIRFKESYQVLNPGKKGGAFCTRVSGEIRGYGVFDCELSRGNKFKKVLHGQCSITENEVTCSHYSPLCTKNDSTCEKVTVQYVDPKPSLDQFYKVLS